MSTFTRQITELLPDDLYRELQEGLWVNPTLGALMPGSGGLRKVRWQLPGKGKRGGIRVIYYWYSPATQIYMLLAYGKSEQEDLTQQQLKVLKTLVKQEFGDRGQCKDAAELGTGAAHTARTGTRFTEDLQE